MCEHTISQIEYYREAGYFASEFDIETVYTAVRNLIGTYSSLRRNR